MKNANSKHLAFKCTYNNGGEGRYAGFNGTCSNENIKYNIDHKHIWCSDIACQCSGFYRNNFAGERPNDPCYESRMFSDKYIWSFSAGYKQSGLNRGDPMRIRHADIGSIVVLTTRFPDETINNIVKRNDIEEKRRIIGFFRAGEVREDKGEQTVIISDGLFDIKLPLRIAKQTYFWDNYSINSDMERWGTGLFRYMTSKDVNKMLNDVLALLLKRPTEAVLIGKIENLIKLL